MCLSVHARLIILLSAYNNIIALGLIPTVLMCRAVLLSFENAHEWIVENGHFENLLQIAMPGEFLFCGNIPEEMKQAAREIVCNALEVYPSQYEVKYLVLLTWFKSKVIFMSFFRVFWIRISLLLPPPGFWQ